MSLTWATKDVTIGDNGRLLAEAILKKVAIAVTDGSYEEATGQIAAGYRLTTDYSMTGVEPPKAMEAEGTCNIPGT